MDKIYDVIVVGAGNGGLVAAANCAKSGLKTVLLEKHNLPGGCASSFVRGRFEFEPSLHELSNVGSDEAPDEIYKVFKNLNAKVNWRYEYSTFRAIVKGKDGYDVKLPASVDKFCEEIEKIVPGSRESLDKLFALVKNIADTLAYLDTCDNKPNYLKFFFKYADFLRLASHSAEEVMDSLGMPQKTRDIICTYWSYLGVPTDELNCMHFLTMLNGYVSCGAAMPYKRSHELSLALEKSFLDFGGEVYYNTKVTEFLFNEGGAAIGVSTDNNTYYAKQIISNVIPNSVYNMANGPIPKADTKLANARELGLSVATVYLGLDCSKEELGINDYTVFVMNSSNARKQYDNRNNCGIYIVNCLNCAIPDCTPKGTSTLFFTMPLLGEDIPVDLKPEDYKKYKNELARKYIEDYEKVSGISIIPHIEEISIATPITFARYLGTPDGTIYGYKLSDWDNIINRIVSSEKEHTIENLIFCGGHGDRGDGYSSAYNSGEVAAKIAINKIKEGK